MCRSTRSSANRERMRMREAVRSCSARVGTPGRLVRRVVSVVVDERARRVGRHGARVRLGVQRPVQTQHLLLLQMTSQSGDALSKCKSTYEGRRIRRSELTADCPWSPGEVRRRAVRAARQVGPGRCRYHARLAPLGLLAVVDAAIQRVEHAPGLQQGSLPDTSDYGRHASLSGRTRATN